MVIPMGTIVDSHVCTDYIKHMSCLYCRVENAVKLLRHKLDLLPPSRQLFHLCGERIMHVFFGCHQVPFTSFESETQDRLPPTVRRLHSLGRPYELSSSYGLFRRSAAKLSAPARFVCLYLGCSRLLCVIFNSIARLLYI